MLNPEEGVYDFSEMDKWLNIAKTKDDFISFSSGNEREYVSWINQKIE